MPKLKLTKKQLDKIWKQLDGANEALERLEEYGVDTNIDFSAITGLKNRVEEMSQRKARKSGNNVL